jgi:hypothetical protein
MQIPFKKLYGWGLVSSGGAALVYQVQGPKFKSQYCPQKYAGRDSSCL